ncbi:MAG: MFS transporter [Oscillospiraceae bacterium]|nr:MFS transporter [Oscillospiraceae bacterium]
MENKTYLGKKELWMFALGAGGQGMIYAMMSSYISDYYVNVLQLPLIFVLLLMLLARVWDAINDPLMGIIVDRRTTKRGKMKPYILFAGIPIAVLTVLMYLSPDLPKKQLMIYTAIVYVAWGMIYTMADVPFWSLPNVLTPDAAERGSVISLGRTINGVGSAIPEVLFFAAGFILPGILGVSDGIAYNKTKYLVIAVATVLIGTVLYINTYFNVKERVIIPDKKPVKGEPSRLSRIFKCKPLMLVILMGILSSGRYMVQAAAVHVARYAFYIGPELTADMSAQTRLEYIDASVSAVKTIFQVCAIVGMFGAMLFMPKLMQKFDYKKIVITTCLLGFAASMFTTVIGWFTANLYICIPFILISCIPLGVLNVISYAMIGDCLDYMELTTGYRDNALGSACQGFVNKLGNAFATCGIVLMYMFIGIKPENMLSSDFIMAATDLTRTQNFAMFSLVSIVPGVSLLLCSIPMFFYKISGKEKADMLEKLQAKREEEGILIEK